MANDRGRDDLQGLMVDANDLSSEASECRWRAQNTLDSLGQIRGREGVKKWRDFRGQIAQPPVRNAGGDSMLGSCSTFVVAWSRPNTADRALSAIPPPETCQA
jgi:hypothetical protein